MAKNPTCGHGGDMVSYPPFSPHGEVAQLVEHHVRNVRVGGSTPLFSTTFGENEKAAFAQ